MYAPKTYAQIRPEGGRNFIILFARAEYQAVNLDRMNIGELTGQNNYEFSPSLSYADLIRPPQDDQINKVAKINAHLWQFVADLPEEIYVPRLRVLLRDSIKEFMTSNDITYSTL
jgi:hypothetical protein